MEITHYVERQRLISWGRQVQGIARGQSDEHASHRIDHAIKQLEDGRFTLAVMGKVKRGKSTLINAFLGRTDDVLAPVGKMPATAVISRFTVGDEQATVHFRDGRSEIIAWRNIHDYVTETGNPENVKDVDCIDVAGPFHALERDLWLVDTPGAGSMHKHHDAMLHGVLPQADAVIFLVTARMPIAADELELLRALKGAEIDKIFFAINKVDASDDDEIEDGIAHNLEMLGAAGVTVDQIHRISAKKAMDGDIAGSGLNDLLSDVATHVRDNRVKLLHDNFRASVFTIAQGVLDDLGTVLSSADRSAAELRQELSEIRTRQREMPSSCTVPKRRFLHKWDSAVDALAIDLTDAEDRVHDQVQARIAAASTVSIKSLVKKMPSVLVEDIEKEVQPVWAQCEAAMHKAAAEFENELPDLTLPRPGRTFVTARGKAGTISSGIGKGVILAGTGIGIQGLAAGLGGAITGSLAIVPVIGTAVGGFLGTAVVVAAAPVCLLLVGLGAVGVITSYRTSRIGIKGELARVCERQVRDVFVRLRTDRLNALRSLGAKLWDDYAIDTEARFKSRCAAYESALSDRDEAAIESTRIHHSQLQLLLED